MVKRNVYTNFLIVVLVLVAYSTTALAQFDSGFSDLPPVPGEYGKCYAKCKIPDRYETRSQQILLKEASVKKVTSPAVFETVSDRILVKEESKRLIPVPAKYETVTERILVKDASTVSRDVAPKYRTATEKVLVSAAYGEWKRKKKSPNCFSGNPDDCYIMCWEEVPAKYKTVTKRVLVTPGSTSVKEVPAQYKTVTKRVLVSPATVREEVIPAEYKTVTRRVVSVPERTEDIAIPAEYGSVDEKVKVSSGGYTRWVEILCQQDTTPGRVRAVQQALNNLGYSAGPVDGIMGSQTRSALTKYQGDKGLPVGNLNLETLQSLGVNY